MLFLHQSSVISQYLLTLSPINHGQSGKWRYLKGNTPIGDTPHFYLNHDHGRKGSMIFSQPKDATAAMAVLKLVVSASMCRSFRRTKAWWIELLNNENEWFRFQRLDRRKKYCRSKKSVSAESLVWKKLHFLISIVD